MKRMTYEIEPEDLSDVEKSALALVGYSKGGRMDGDTRVQKLGFMAIKSSGNKDLDNDFDYRPHNFGPYSENLDYGIQQLIDYGLVAPIGKPPKFVLTDDGKRVLNEIEEEDNVLADHIREMVKDLEHLSNDDLISIVYELYPTFTTNSIIVDKVKFCKRSDAIHVPLAKLKEGGKVAVTSRCGVKVIASMVDGVLRLEQPRR